MERSDPAVTYIALGSNLENPIKQIQTALQTLSQIPNTNLIKHSSYYQSPPLPSKIKQPDYINVVAELETELKPLDLLEQLQVIEKNQGRIRKEHWGPRTIDLDLLLYANLEMQTEILTIPHPGLTQRNFVLYPLHEIAPDLRLPNGKLLSEYLKGV